MEFVREDGKFFMAAVNSPQGTYLDVAPPNNLKSSWLIIWLNPVAEENKYTENRNMISTKV